MSAPNAGAAVRLGMLFHTASCFMGLIGGDKLCSTFIVGCVGELRF